MAEPTHLSIEILHRLMRLFMEHKTDVLPVVERGRIVGQLERVFETVLEDQAGGRMRSAPLVLAG